MRPGFRGRGLSRRMLDLAHEEAARRDFALGMLFCFRSLVGLYRRCGWEVLSGRYITRLSEEGGMAPLREGNVAMVRPIALSGLPDGDIHLQGNDW